MKTLELWLAGLSLIWGLWVLSPFWDTFQSVRTYHIMSDVAPEWVWGLVMCLSAILNLFAMLRNHSILRRFALSGAVFIWFFISVSAGLSNYASPAAPLYGFVAITKMVLLARNH